MSLKTLSENRGLQIDLGYAPTMTIISLDSGAEHADTYPTYRSLMPSMNVDYNVARAGADFVTWLTVMNSADLH